MSLKLILIAIGVVLFFLGLAKRGNSFNVRNITANCRNIGINIGGTNTQTISVSGLMPDMTRSKKPDWIGLTISVIGLLTALVGLLKH